MPPSRLNVVASAFQSNSEALHDKFQAMRSDVACTGCQSAGFGEAILAAWLQTKWSDFARELVIASALGTRRTRGNSVKPVTGVKTRADAERFVKAATKCVIKNRRLPLPVWHSPSFVVEVGTLIKLRNLRNIEAVLGPTLVPEQITDFRNYLVHPGKRTRYKYESLQAKLGMLRIEPEQLLHQQQRPGVPVFTSWVRELQRIANDSTR